MSKQNKSILDKWTPYGKLSIAEKEYVKNIIPYTEARGYYYDMKKLQVLMENGINQLEDLK